MGLAIDPEQAPTKHRRGLTRNVISIVVVPLTVLMVPILVVLAWLSFYVNPLDIIFANEHVIASVETSSGDVVELTQFWNRSDFYTTTIKRRDSQGILHEIVVDGDDNKIWRGSIARDTDTGRLIVRKNGKPLYSIELSTWRITYYNATGDWERFLID